jgi:hypothetical protein
MLIDAGSRKYQTAGQGRSRAATGEWQGIFVHVDVTYAPTPDRSAGTSRRALERLLLHFSTPTPDSQPNLSIALEDETLSQRLVLSRRLQIMNRMRRNSMSYELTERAWRAAEKVYPPHV